MNVARTSCLCAVGVAIALSAAARVAAQLQLTPLDDMVLDTGALLMPITAPYGRAINGVAFQGERLLTYNGYQYATWYHNSSQEDLYVARRNLNGSTWEVRDTGSNFDNGDSPAWDAHNVVSLGISGDGRLHFSWDMHGNTLRYRNSAAGVATNPGSTDWSTFAINTERSALNAGGTTVTGVTYPQFTTKPNGDMVFNYRTGASGNGDVWLTTYRTSTGLWDAPHQFINGTTDIFYNDPYGSSSVDRNAYINGLTIDATGRMHVTWTWREAATGSSNHDICYAYSDDGGDTWLNNAGAVIATVGSPITLSSQGITIVPMDRGNTLMNQQTQAVDEDGRVQILMWHKTDAAAPVTGFTTTPAAYYHYFRDPASGVWTRTSLPTERAVGSRPDMAYDAEGNIYAAYVSPGPGDGQGVLNYYTEGDLVIASASKATGYTDWSIVHTDTRDFAGEPHIDQTRLSQYGVLSVTLQENDDVNTGKTGTPLRVLEYEKLAKHLVWAGDGASTWNTGPGTDWDSNGNDVGDAAFASGNRVTFDDGATSFHVNIAGPVSPSLTTFRNTAAKSYTLNGAGIGGAGPLTIAGSGAVTLANGVNTYSGATNITSGKLALSGTATIANSPTINVAAGATFDVTGTTSGGVTLSNQTLIIDGDVQGNVVATNNSAVRANSADSLHGNLTVQSGSIAMGSGRIYGNLTATGGAVRVGGAGLPTGVGTVTTVVDNFNAPGLSEYTLTRVLDNAVAQANVSFSDSSSALAASYGGSTSAPEQVVLLRNDVSLSVGQTLLVDVNMPATSTTMDFGLAVSATASPAGVGNPTPTDTRTTFDWASVSVRPSQDAIRVNRSVNGTLVTDQGVLSANETSVSQLFVERTSSTSFTVGYIDSGSVRFNAQTVNFTATNVGTAIGFYADLRTVGGSLGSFDNLRIVAPNQAIALGETLTIDGDYAQQLGATLELDIHSPTAHDVLKVGGNFTAGGTLSVLLDAGAPAPQGGDAYDILDFASLSGVFDSVLLPALAPGFLWDNSLLLSSGVVKVVAGLAGDFNHDLTVDAADYVVWRELLGQVGAGLAADGNADLHVDENDYSLWRANYGATLSAAASHAGVAVPEPGAIFLLAAATIVHAMQVRRSVGSVNRERFAASRFSCR